MPARQLVSHPLSQTEKIGILATLRKARALVLRDAEGFHDAATAIEHVGQILCGEVRNGLGHYKTEIIGLAKKAVSFNQAGVAALFETVRRARNDAVHGGSHIRHHATRLVELILVLEEAVVSEAVQIQDVMVRNPTCVEMWENAEAARRKLLADAFSFLPVEVAAGRWALLSDLAVAKYLSDSTERKQRLGKSISEARADGLRLERCTRYLPTKLVSDVTRKISHQPVLVVERKRLLGIVTAFDLL